MAMGFSTSERQTGLAPWTSSGWVAHAARPGWQLTHSPRVVTVGWYHDTMTKNITVRLPDELAADAEALARVDGTSLNETVKKSMSRECTPFG